MYVGFVDTTALSAKHGISYSNDRTEEFQQHEKKKTIRNRNIKKNNKLNRTENEF